MTTLPGRGVAAICLYADDSGGETWAQLERGCFVAESWFDPVLTEAPRISRSYSEPMRGLQSFDRVRLSRYVNPASAGAIGTRSAAHLTLHPEVGGTFDPDNDILWRGRVARGGISRQRYVETIEGIDVRGFALDGATLGRRSIDEETYPNAPDRYRDELIPVCLGNFTGDKLAVEAKCLDAAGNLDGETPTGDPTYCYQDTHDRNGNLLSTTASGFLVVYYDGQEYSTIREAWEAGGITDITAHCTGTHDHAEATFQVDVSGVGITWDCQRHVCVVQFQGAILAGSELTDSPTMTRGGIASIAATLYVAHAGLDPSLIDSSVIEAIDAKSPLVYRAIQSGTATDEALGSLYGDLFVQERVTPAGLITMRTRWDFEPLTSSYTVAERHLVDWPREQVSPFDPPFTTLTVERNHLPYAPEEMITTGAIRDDLLVAENGGQEIAHTHRTEWLGTVEDMRSLAEYMLATRSSRSRIIQVQVRLDDPDEQIGIQPGDVAAVNLPGIAENELLDTMGVELDAARMLSTLTWWANHEPGVFAGMLAGEGGSAAATTTSGTAGLFVLMDGWSNVALDQHMEADAATNVVTVLYGGLYRVKWRACVQGDAGTYGFQVGTGTSLAARFIRSEGSVTIGATNDIKPARGAAIVELSPGDELGLYVKTDGTSRSVKLHAGALFLKRISRRFA